MLPALHLYGGYRSYTCLSASGPSAANVSIEKTCHVVAKDLAIRAVHGWCQQQCQYCCHTVWSSLHLVPRINPELMFSAIFSYLILSATSYTIESQRTTGIVLPADKALWCISGTADAEREPQLWSSCSDMACSSRHPRLPQCCV